MPLNRIEVRRVGQQVWRLASSTFDELPDPFALVCPEVASPPKPLRGCYAVRSIAPAGDAPGGEPATKGGPAISPGLPRSGSPRLRYALSPTNARKPASWGTQAPSRLHVVSWRVRGATGPAAARCGPFCPPV